MAQEVDRPAKLPVWLAQAIWQAAGARKTIRASSPGERIGQGHRNTALASLAGSMRRRGMTESEIAAALLVANSERCDPPLDERDVRRIARSVSRYEPADPLVIRVERGEVDPQDDPETLAEAGAGIWQALTAREVCELEADADGDQIIGEILVRGHRLVVAGDTGHGKSAFCLHLAQVAAHGGEFLGMINTCPTRVLVIDVEMGLRSVQRKLRAVGLSESDNVWYLRIPDGLELPGNTAHLQRLESILRDGAFDVVVLDPLYKAHVGDSSEERAIVDLMKVFDRWRAAYRFAFVLPVHVRKRDPKAKFSMQDVFGSSAIRWGAEVIVGLERIADERALLHFWKDRDGDLPVGKRWTLGFDPATARFSVLEQETTARVPSVVQIVEYLHSIAPDEATVRDIAIATGFSESTVKKGIVGCDEVEEVRRVGRGGAKTYRYRPADSDITRWERMASE